MNGRLYGHAALHDPPQSMPVSSPFWSPSSHVGARHLPAQQTRLWQLFPVSHSTSSGQGLQLSQPQSMPVSLSFFTPSL